jgi:two-component system heavy metal sensor histidine kinase CusS
MPLNINHKPSSLQSLAKKLALLYATTTFSVLLIASGLLYWSILDHLQKEHESLLTTKIFKLRQYFKDSSLLNETLRGLIDAEHHHSLSTHSSAIHPGIPHHIFLRIFDERGNLLVESNTPQAFPKSLNFPLVDQQDISSIAIIKVNPEKNHLFLLGSAWAITTSMGQPRKVLIQALLKLAPDEPLLTDFQRTLTAVLIFGVLASAFTGFWVTRRGLRPLRQITKTIQNINVQQLNEQINSGQWPKEIALLANAFDQMLARLDQSFARLSQFSADLAHELRTPVNNLMGTTEVALSRARSSEEYHEILESSMEEYARIARMIDELLFLAKAEDPKTEINCIVFPIENEFNLIKEFYDSLASDQQIEIICHSNQVELYADPNLFRRVLSNLISNAMHSIKTHGCINISASYTSDQSIKIIISDTGEGIAEDILPHIFDRFFRADKSRHHNKQGSGLGLAIVKSIMELHGGHISISSQLQQGTQVELSFPAKPSENP